MSVALWCVALHEMPERVYAAGGRLEDGSEPQIRAHRSRGRRRDMRCRRDRRGSRHVSSAVNRRPCIAPLTH